MTTTTEQVTLLERTAGLRLAALSLTGHPDPARFAAGFSGTDRTAGEHLLAEVPDGSRSWFRYHQMFAVLLQLELGRTVGDAYRSNLSGRP